MQTVSAGPTALPEVGTNSQHSSFFSRTSDPFPVLLQIEIRQCFFTDETSAEFRARSAAGERILFISDIRTAKWTEMDGKEVERRVKADQDLQAGSVG
jgi:hypothetical protein